MDMSKPQFLKEEAVIATGLKPSTLGVWLDRGVVKPTLENPGPGQPRKFSANSIVELAVIAKLVEFGISPSPAAEIVDSCLAKDPGIMWVFVSKAPNGKYVVSFSVKDRVEDIWSPREWYSDELTVVLNIGKIRARVLSRLNDRDSGEQATD